MVSDKIATRFKKRGLGYTLDEIAAEEGITRQAVHQSLILTYGSTNFTTYLNPLRLSQLLKIPMKRILEYRRAGVIKQVNTSYWRPLYSVDAVKAIIAHRSCQICGAFIPLWRQHYCSPECAKKAGDKAHARCLWRRFLKKSGQPVTPCNAYIREPKGAEG